MRYVPSAIGNSGSGLWVMGYPQTHIQICIVHQVRHSLHYVPDKDRKAVTAGLKSIYQAATVQTAQIQLDEFAARWDNHYPNISRL